MYGLTLRLTSTASSGSDIDADDLFLMKYSKLLSGASIQLTYCKPKAKATSGSSIQYAKTQNQ
jgi:hypothetical protein